jgi:hypothetical protein
MERVDGQKIFCGLGKYSIAQVWTGLDGNSLGRIPGNGSGDGLVPQGRLIQTNLVGGSAVPSGLVLISSLRDRVGCYCCSSMATAPPWLSPVIVARSNFPSPLKSAITGVTGPESVLRSTELFRLKVPWPFPRKKS